MTSIEYYQFVKYLVSLGIGFLIGLERERRQEREIFAGVRTLPLVAVSGTLLLEYFPQLLLPAFLFLGSLLVVAYVVKVQSFDIGMTTSIATLLTFVFGAMCSVSERGMSVAVMLGIVTAVLLAIKDPLHQFANRIDPDEMHAVLKFLVIALVIFPLLPDEGLEVLLGLNPQFVWLMVILVSGIGFGAYVLTKLLGTRTGIGLTGLLGGMISSTATTVAMARKSIDREEVSTVAAFSVVIACLAMFPRILIEILVIAPTLARPLLIPIGVMILAGLFPAGIVFLTSEQKAITDTDPENPFRLKPALIFGGLFAVILLVSEYALKWYGNAGILAASGISGLADVDAITLSVGRLIQKGEIPTDLAVQAIIIGAISNTIVKVGLSWVLGGSDFARKVTVVMGLSIFGGLGSLFFL